MAMPAVSRKQVEERAYQIWQEAGCPEGSSLAHWLQAEIELGVIPKTGPDDPLVTLQELAVAARERDHGAEPANDALQQSVGASVPDAEAYLVAPTTTRSASTSKASRKGR